MSQANPATLKDGAIVRGPMFPEPVKILALVPLGTSVNLIGLGTRTSQTYQVILGAAQQAELELAPQKALFDGNAIKFKLGVEALRLGLAYEYDPYFSLSIARVDPLPHQLEAVYDYFLKMPRIRFLLADDPGAGKTIMAGLLLKELKIRGLVQRTLIVTPANLCFQWQREMKDKFRESFEVVRSDVLRANYGMNPWQERDQVITSVAWVSRIEDAKESLLRSHWDLIIVDEAHKMSASSHDSKTLAYQLGEALSERTDHFLLMTATPHKGDPTNFCLFLSLLDRDVYGDVASLQEAMDRHSAPFYLRRTKEALVSFPDPETGTCRKLYTRRKVETVQFPLSSEEQELYFALTSYVEDQTVAAQAEGMTPRSRALSFAMAMLQRRFASSVFALRRSLERMREKREKILADPERWRQEQIKRSVPRDFDDLPEDEQDRILEDLEATVASLDPAALQEEIVQLDGLIRKARELEKPPEVESKLRRLKEVLADRGVFGDPRMKLLIFTEHKDTLDYLTGKLREWGLSVTQIHGGMKVGDRDTPGTRIYAEREFKEAAQVMVATEAAGEGINLQFCWFMVNYDIPWNPIRLEQRMGRIHRYGQEKDCLILNFVSINTREGRVLAKLFERLEKIEADLDPDRLGTVFNVLGDIFPANELEGMVRNMYARSLTEEALKDRIVREVDIDRFRRITRSTLENLARRELNLSDLIGREAEARERRLVPEVVRDFFLGAAPEVGLSIKEIRRGEPHYALGRVPRALLHLGERLEGRFGRLGSTYPRIVFDKRLLQRDATLEWVTPGHPLFEAAREEMLQRASGDLERGCILLDLHAERPYRLDLYTASLRDGRAQMLHRRLFAMQVASDGTLAVKQPTLLLDLQPAPSGTVPPELPLPDDAEIQTALIHLALEPFLADVAEERRRESDRVAEHVDISLRELIHRQNLRFSELHEDPAPGPTHAAQLKQVEDRLDELNGRRERRLEELKLEGRTALADLTLLGRAWVLPHPERSQPEIAAMVSDTEAERIAVEEAIRYEEARGCRVESVEDENRGFDLISRRPHPEDPATAREVRFIEVKGRSGQGEVALTPNEYRTAERLREDYWLYVVYNCASTPELHAIQDPSRMDWKPLVKVEHYRIGPSSILEASEGTEPC